jgi:hypothetical protein
MRALPEELAAAIANLLPKNGTTNRPIVADRANYPKYEIQHSEIRI